MVRVAGEADVLCGAVGAETRAGRKAKNGDDAQGGFEGAGGEGGGPARGLMIDD